MICVICINCSYNNNNIAKGIRLLEKMFFFVYTGNISYKLELLKVISLKELKRLGTYLFTQNLA